MPAIYASTVFKPPAATNPVVRSLFENKAITLPPYELLLNFVTNRDIKVFTKTNLTKEMIPSDTADFDDQKVIGSYFIGSKISIEELHEPVSSTFKVTDYGRG